ncbi:MAG: polysaccharide pyruvyl transferase family protein [Desulfuromonas sp.]|nr:polysaccharide pyruvyl transferase family protein [Desulfuromonas sp.]
MTKAQQQPLKVYWSSGLKNGRKNFGDWLSPKLCEAISGRPVIHAKHQQCDLVACGSILQRLKNHLWTRPVHVWGTGIIEEMPSFSTRHQIDAVRGKLTANMIKNRRIGTLGDPGLLCGLLLPAKPIEKKFRVGIIPHYMDQQQPLVQTFIKQPGVVFIDIFSDTIEFLQQVAQCEVVLSSSLHGLVAADALQIPNAWIRLSDNVRGNDFKFADYYSVFGLEEMQPYPFSAGTDVESLYNIYETYNRPQIDRIKQELLDAFPFR